ncbi:arsenite-resistance protein 2-domain-containing protein [Absidia repens]|uniref:Arsenite-resistance protein 2-domain-containing protein n=1 Tax=Absidia repens TaxID=90262 RepID=A0A1X2I422_9FUNG|nr:arsenite-resistance protein 2-domain-containing protein [Absidia repens]
MAGGNWSTLSRIHLIDPHQLDYVVSFKQYCDYLRQTHPKLTDDEFQTRYDDYKEMISVKQLPQFFANNKEKQWFLEKYHPHLSKARVDDTKQRRLHNLTTFMQALQHGDYDRVYYDSKDTDITSNNDGTAEEINTDNSNIDDTLSNKEAFDNHLVIKTVPPTISRQKIIDMCNKVNGFQYLALSEPSVTKKFHRIGWIHFSEETDMQKVFDELDNQKIDDFTFHLAMNRKNQLTSGRSRRTAPDITNTPERLSVDLDQATQLAKAMDTELEKDGLQDVINRARSIINTNSDTVDNKDHSDLSMDEGSDHLLATKKELDMILVYLRHVHMYCYYCGLECDSIEELNRKCLNPHHRKVSSGGVSDQKQMAKNERLTQQWIKSLDQRIRMKVHPLNDEDLVKAGGRSLKSETDAYLSEHIQKEHDAKFKCKVGDCAKAFKGVEFVEKHIISKHGDEIQRIKDDVMYYNNYVCDPNHLVMATSNINGNNNSGNSNHNIMNGGGTMGNANTGSDNNSNSSAHSAAGAPPYVLTLSPNGLSLQAASLGTPWDKIPRIGFGGNVGWPASMAGRLGARMGSGSGGKSSSSHQVPASTSEMMLDMPQDPRQVKSYIDLDAPTDDGANISFY